MWTVLSAIIPMVSTLFGYYITGTKTKKDLEAAASAFAIAKGRGNQSADDREDIKAQKERLKEIKKSNETKEKK